MPDNRIRADNDDFRRACAHTRPIVFWRGSAYLSNDLLDEILRAIAALEAFSDDNFLHDFGMVVVGGKTYEWTIEYLSADNRPVSVLDLIVRRGISIEAPFDE